MRDQYSARLGHYSTPNIASHLGVYRTVGNHSLNLPLYTTGPYPRLIPVFLPSHIVLRYLHVLRLLSLNLSDRTRSRG